MYWIWANEPTGDDEAMIYGTPGVIEERDLRFDMGVLVNAAVPLIEIARDEDSQGVLTDNLIASGTNGLLFSSRLRTLLESLGIDNIHFFPCVVRNPADGSESTDYQLANIVGRVACLDVANSEITTDPDDPQDIEFIDALALDESKIRGIELFRLHEATQVIVAGDRVKSACEGAKITGVRFYAPADFTL
jgi:hypothetical protein